MLFVNDDIFRPPQNCSRMPDRLLSPAGPDGHLTCDPSLSSGTPKKKTKNLSRYTGAKFSRLKQNSRAAHVATLFSYDRNARVPGPL